MDTPLLISVIVLAVIASVEIYCLFLCHKLQEDIMPISAAVPVFPGDDQLRERLEYLSCILSDPTSKLNGVILINYSADDEQLELCRQFCEKFSGSFLIEPEDIKNFLSKTFAFDQKT